MAHNPLPGSPRKIAPKPPDFAQVLESAAHLQRLVPDTVLVGGSAAAVHAKHRLSVDHDHILYDLALRFEAVLDAVESDEGWATNRVTPGKVILGNLDGIETGIRQLIRRRPLEVEVVELPSGSLLRVPTVEEALRVKAFLVVRRNQTRDYLDCAALSGHVGVNHAARTVSAIDAYYADQIGDGEGVATQVMRQFADPRPKDVRVTAELSRYKSLAPRWTDWAEVQRVLGEVATEMANPSEDSTREGVY